MKFKYPVFLVIFFIASVPVYSQVQIHIKPSASIFFPSSDNLTGYYDRENTFSCGAELNLTSNFYGLGGYFQYSGYKVNITDDNRIGGRRDEKSTIISFGLLKSLDTPFFNIITKAGVSLHKDDLALADDDVRYGFRLGLEISKNILSRFGLFIGLDYDYNELSVPSYRTFAYSRHNAYLSGKTLSTGGIFLNAGVSIQVL